MSDKIQVAAPLVVLHGDEMAQIAFERILDMFVHQRLEIPLVEIDLSAENRLFTNGAVVRDAIAALTTWASAPAPAMPISGRAEMRLV